MILQYILVPQLSRVGVIKISNTAFQSSAHLLGLRAQVLELWFYTMAFKNTLVLKASGLERRRKEHISVTLAGHGGENQEPTPCLSLPLYSSLQCFSHSVISLYQYLLSFQFLFPSAQYEGVVSNIIHYSWLFLQ